MIYQATIPSSTNFREQAGIGKQANICHGEGAVSSQQQSPDKKNERQGSKTGKNYNFQGKLIVGMEEGKGLRERERFIREQFSGMSSEASGIGSISVSRQNETNRY